MSGGPSIQYSPDGSWWWDGSQWRPVPGQSPQPQAPWQGSGQVYQPTAAQQVPAARTRFPVAAVTVLTVFALLLVFGGVGLFFELRSLAGRLSSEASPAVPAVPLPARTPGSSLVLPSIHGVTVSQVTTALQAKGYSCTNMGQVAGAWVTSCTLTDQNGDLYEVSLGGSDSTSVGLISAGLVSDPRGPPASADASRLFTLVVNAISQGSQASQVDAWIQQHLDSGGETTAGDLHLQLGRPDHNYLLVITSSTTP